MDLQTKRDLIDRFIAEKRKGMEYSEIRKKLKEANVEEEHIKKIIRAVDAEVLRGAVNKAEGQQGVEFMLVGAILTVFSLVSFLFLKLSVLVTGSLIAGGPGLFIVGYNKYKKAKQS
ncbi:MAG: hypothetical protein JJ975_02800 [Bacteroidia bacterium]|nr:hypothetical protein [Bacteroidia bacterium]